jgi:hypothetical protein
MRLQQAGDGVRISLIYALAKKAFNHEREACEVQADANNASPR